MYQDFHNRNKSNEFIRNVFNYKLIFSSLIFVILMTFSIVVISAPYTVTRYIKVDHHGHSAYVFDENFNQLPDNPYIPHTSIEVFPSEHNVWYLGSKIDIVRKNSDGSIDVKSDDPRYYEMNHHAVWIYVSDHRKVTDVCGYNRPLAAGSELADIRFPSGYGYKIKGGALFPSTWHWENPASVPASENIYLRFSVLLDDATTDYTDTNVTWIDTVPCSSAFNVPPGNNFKIKGPDYTLPTKARIVSVTPHIHDHAKKLELRINGKKIRTFKPENAEIAVAHDDVGDGPTPLHTDKQHLPSEGLNAWSPGINGPIIYPGDVLSTHSVFNNTHARDIDNMAINTIIWEEL